MIEYLKFAGEVMIPMTIIAVMVSIIVVCISAMGCFGFWLWDKIREEKSQWQNWDK
jgi:hypothetical protein